MELEVGMYVRTKKGTLFKVEWLNEVYYGTYEKNGRFYQVLFENINGKIPYKSSFNLIDLIEDDDIVEIEYYVKKYKKRISRKFVFSKVIDNFISFENTHCTWTMTFENNKWNWNEAKGFNPKIKSIVTHEQFDSVKYEVKGE